MILLNRLHRGEQKYAIADWLTKLYKVRQTITLEVIFRTFFLGSFTKRVKALQRLIDEIGRIFGKRGKKDQEIFILPSRFAMDSFFCFRLASLYISIVVVISACPMIS